MIKVLRLLQGYVIFEATGGFAERFLNLCKVNKINLWNVKNNGVKIVAFTSANEFWRLDIPAKNSGMEIKIIKKCGLPFWIKSYKWRCGAVLGVFLCIILLAALSCYIWDVEIVSNDGVKIEGFTEALEDLGVKSGAKKSEIDIPTVQEAMLDSFSELSWVSVNIFGTKARVEYSYAKPQNPILDKYSLTNVVARKSGEIIRVEGYSGTDMVKAGEYVVEGSLLISGIVKNADSTESLVHASGKVLARTENSKSYERIYKQMAYVIGNEGAAYKFRLFAFDVPFGRAPKDATAKATDILLKGNETVLPFGFIRTDYFEGVEREVCFTQSQSGLLALLDSVNDKREEYGNSDIESVEYTLVHYNDKSRVNVNIVCIEDIAVEIPVQTE